MRDFLRNRVLFVTMLVVSATFFGTLGYRVLENWNWIDSFYMTIITLTTVGFGETNPLSPAGRLFTVILIAGGIGIVAYASSTFVEILVSGDLQNHLAFRRRHKMLAKMHDHYIVCGYGRMGRYVVRELAVQKKPLVIIDQSEEVVDNCREMGFMALVGDAADETLLAEVGVTRARSLIATASSDAQNVFIVLTARELCPTLTIISRMNRDESESKLRRAGANEVISPYAIGGKRMVTYVERPGVVDFLDLVMHATEIAFQLEEFVVHEHSPLVGCSLQDAKLRTRYGVNILAIRLPGHPISAHPNTDEPLPVGTHLIVLGTRDQLTGLSDVLKPIKPISRKDNI